MTMLRRANAWDLIDIAASVFSVHANEMFRRHRRSTCSDAVEARAVVCVLMLRVHSIAYVAEFFRLHHSTVIHWRKRVANNHFLQRKLHVVDSVYEAESR